MDVTCDTSGSKCMFHGNFLLGWILASPSMATNFFWYLEAHSKSWAYRTVNVFLICSFYFTLLLACYSDFSIYRPCLYSTKHFTPGPGRSRWVDTKWEWTMDCEICKIFRHKIWSHSRIMGRKGWAYSSNHTLG